MKSPEDYTGEGENPGLKGEDMESVGRTESAEIKSTVDFGSAENIDEIHKMIDESGGIGNYSVDELHQMIDNAISTKNMKFITREGGLRDKVKEIIESNEGENS